MNIIKSYFEYTDERGSIKGLINFGQWEELNIIKSEKGMIRGNHFHELTKELFIIIDGEINVKVQKVENSELKGKISHYKMFPGDTFIVDKNVNHIFEIIKDSRWINALSKKMDNINLDIKKIRE